MQHISFDLEALTRSSIGPLVQIGACKFDPVDGIGDTFIRTVKLSSLKKYGLDICPETLEWWMQQEPAAIASVFNVPDAVSLRQALWEYVEWVGKHGDYVYWSHSTYDPPLLFNNFNAVGINSPIPFRAYRDIRTLMYLSGPVTLEREGVHHNALDDAIHQAKYISIALNRITSWTTK